MKAIICCFVVTVILLLPLSKQTSSVCSPHCNNGCLRNGYGRCDGGCTPSRKFKFDPERKRCVARCYHVEHHCIGCNNNRQLFCIKCKPGYKMINPYKRTWNCVRFKQRAVTKQITTEAQTTVQQQATQAIEPMEHTTVQLQTTELIEQTTVQLQTTELIAPTTEGLQLQTTEMSEVDWSGNCSFPFTYDGNLYYGCINNSNFQWSQCLIITSGNLTKCSTKLIGFLAVYTVINVTIPVNETVNPYQSVNNWIIILSRPNNNTFRGVRQSASYINGFNLNNEFWMGLATIQLITNPANNGGQSYKLRFEILTVETNQWISEEYDSFYLEDSPYYTFRSSAIGYGDAGDNINRLASVTNGNAWVYNFTNNCFRNSGPWWYSTTSPCSYCRLFSRANTTSLVFNGGYWAPYTVYTARMMIKLTGN